MLSVVYVLCWAWVMVHHATGTGPGEDFATIFGIVICVMGIIGSLVVASAQARHVHR